MAMKKAVEVVTTLRYHLRAMGAEVSRKTRIFVDNKSVLLNVTNPASTLNKKALALAHHFVREHQHGEVINAQQISSEDNHADCLTKALNSTALHALMCEFMNN